MKHVVIHTDGSCLGNPGPGGWAAILRYQDREREMSGGFALTTNNRMEILAVLMALGGLKEPCLVDLHTDSQYVARAVREGWLRKWRGNGWRSAAGKPVRNRDLWERLPPLLERHDVRFHWLKGHAGHPENERCDALARAQAMLPGLAGDEEFVQASGEG